MWRCQKITWLRPLVASGQNVRLAVDLTGWTINVMSLEEAADKQEAEAAR